MRPRRPGAARSPRRSGSRARRKAAAILARGTAEAEALDKKGRAFQDYGDAAILDLLVRVLPDLVREASAPMSAIDSLTVISTDGASALTKNVASNVTQGLALAGDLTGLDVKAMLARMGTARTESADDSTVAG